MKTLVSGIALALILAGCGSGAPSSKGSLGQKARPRAAATIGQRQAVLDACKPPFTGATGGSFTEDFCGVTLPTDGSDQTPQRWWDAQGCIVDHPDDFSDSCKNLFASTCGNGDDCICNPGFELDEGNNCAPIGACDNDNDCPDVANGTNTCSDTTEHDPEQGQCVLTCNDGFVLSNGACVPSCVPTTCAGQGKNCGSISNGCGGTLNCGACTAPQTCGGGGIANFCATSPTKLIFATSQTYSADLGGLAGADANCQSLAGAAGLAGTYKAWLSAGSVSASSRLTHSTGPYTLTDSTVVAADWTQLTSGTLLHAINKTETGGTPPQSSPRLTLSTVWTATTPDGTNGNGTADCSGWTSTTATVVFFGDYERLDSSWTYSGNGNGAGACGGYALLYCLEQ